MDDANAAFDEALEHLKAAWDSAVENGGDRYIFETEFDRIFIKEKHSKQNETSSQRECLK